MEASMRTSQMISRSPWGNHGATIQPHGITHKRHRMIINLLDPRALSATRRTRGSRIQISMLLFIQLPSVSRNFRGHLNRRTGKVLGRRIFIHTNPKRTSKIQLLTTSANVTARTDDPWGLVDANFDKSTVHRGCSFSRTLYRMHCSLVASLWDFASRRCQYRSAIGDCDQLRPTCSCAKLCTCSTFFPGRNSGATISDGTCGA